MPERIPEKSGCLDSSIASTKTFSFAACHHGGSNTSTGNLAEKHNYAQLPAEKANKGNAEFAKEI